MSPDRYVEPVIDAIGKALGRQVRLAEMHPVGGGCINDARRLELSDGTRLFLKTHPAPPPGMFPAEAEGLAAISAGGAIRVPDVVAVDERFLVLEYIELGGPSDPGRLGRELAEMHRGLGPGFGFGMNNFIGASPQWNTPYRDSWVDFYRDQRLAPQVRWAREKGLVLNGADSLMERLGDFFSDYSPLPSVLHGDLWGGNISYDREGNPVLFDPATYFGDREADIAFTELFGGPGPAFYRAYQETWPLDDGYPLRKDIYNLYHLLNHFNLFGGTYASQAQAILNGVKRRI